MVDDAHGFGVLGEHGVGSTEAAGLDAITLTPEVLRREGGLPVNGWLVAARKPAPAAHATGLAQTAAGRHTQPHLPR